MGEIVVQGHFSTTCLEYKVYHKNIYAAATVYAQFQSK